MRGITSIYLPPKLKYLIREESIRREILTMSGCIKAILDEYFTAKLKDQPQAEIVEDLEDVPISMDEFLGDTDEADLD